MSAPSPALILFARGVIARLSIWETLTLAVQESWGGPGAKEKRTWMAGVLVDLFEEKQAKNTNASSPDPDDVEDMLLQIMADEFEVHVEDGTAEHLGKDLIHLWVVIMGQPENTSSGEKMVQEWEARAERTKGRKIHVEIQDTPEEEGEWEDDDGEEEDEQMEESEEAPPLIDHTKGSKEPEVDEDGFTMVKRRR